MKELVPFAKEGDHALFDNLQELKGSFGALKRDPMNLGMMMAHIAKMSKILDTIGNTIVTKDFLHHAHLEMLQKTPAGWDMARGQVTNIDHWSQFDRVIKKGHEINLNEVPKDKIWFWSDPHFGHNKIIEFSKRPFKDLEHMHEELVKNYNALIQEDDVVIWVGDISFAGSQATEQWINRFNGYKIMVVGNHDIDRDGRLRSHHGFDEVHLSLDFDNTIVTHHPWTCYLPKGMRHIHGHMHNRTMPDHADAYRHFNVAVEVLDYKPIQYSEIDFAFMQGAANHAA